MIDIHSHLLPNCDDGSPDIETSITQLKLMVGEGLTDLVLTPHYMRNVYHNISSVIDDRYYLLHKGIKENKINVNIYKGAEVYLDYNILDDIKENGFAINDTQYVLVETGMSGFPNDLLKILYDLVRNGFKPILAHPERYSNVSQDLQVAEDLIHRNVYMQINAGSLVGSYGEIAQQTAFELIDNGFAHFMASDNHCKSDNYVLPRAIAELQEFYDDNLVELLTETNPRKMLKNEKITYFNTTYKQQKEKGFFSKFFKIFR